MAARLPPPRSPSPPTRASPKTASKAKKQPSRGGVGRYAISGLMLGEGGFGKVWPVEDEKGQKWAMKSIVVHPNLMEGLDPQVIREPATQDVLKHPNLLELHDVIYDEDKHHLNLIMPLARENLWERQIKWRRDRTTNLAEKTARLREKFKCAGSILCGLEYLWARGFMFLDLKADNVLVFDDAGGGGGGGSKTGKGGSGTTSSTYKIGDYGMALPLRSPLWKTRAKTIVTWAWKSPELLCGTRRWNNSVDIWSYGVMLVDLFHNTNPFFDGMTLGKLPGFIATHIGSVANETLGCSSTTKAKKFPPLPQKNGFQLAASLLGSVSTANAWRESFGHELFDALWQLISGCLQVVPSKRHITVPPLLKGLMQRPNCLAINPTPILPAIGTEIADMFRGVEKLWNYSSLDKDTKALAQHIWQRYTVLKKTLAPRKLLPPESQTAWNDSQIKAAACLNLATKAMDDVMIFDSWESNFVKIAEAELVIERTLDFALWRSALAAPKPAPLHPS